MRSGIVPDPELSRTSALLAMSAIACTAGALTLIIPGRFLRGLGGIVKVGMVGWIVVVALIWGLGNGEQLVAHVSGVIEQGVAAIVGASVIRLGLLAFG